MENSIRRYRSNLVISGKVIILFSVWSLLRFGMYLYTHPSLLSQWMGQNFPEFSELNASMASAMMIVIGVIFAVLCGFIVLINVLIGRGAIREGRGKKGGWLYPVLAALYLVGSVVSFFTDFEANDLLTRSVQMGAGLIVDLSCFYAYGCVLYSAFRLRRLLRNHH